MPPKKKGQQVYNSKGQRIDAMARKKDERAVKNAYRKERKAESYFADDENFACFATQLGKMGLYLRDIPGDGNCLFRALGDQLEGHGRNHMNHRLDVVDYMQKHRADFEPFVEDDVPFDRHIALLKKPGTYGGNDTIVAFARLHKLNVVIHQLSSPCWTIQGTDQANPKQLHISYHNGDHYSSVRRAGDTLEQPANIVLFEGKPQVEQPSHSKKSKPYATSVISNGSYMQGAYTGNEGFGGYAGNYGKNVYYGEDSATMTWDTADHEESQLDNVTVPDTTNVPGCQTGMARAVINTDNVVQNVMKATGCKDAKLVKETLEDHFLDVDTTIAFIFQIMATSSPTNGFPGNSFSMSTMGSSSDSGIWSENGTGSRVIGGYDSATISSMGVKPKHTHVSASRIKRDKKLEKKMRATERRRQQFLDDGLSASGYHGLLMSSGEETEEENEEHGEIQEVIITDPNAIDVDFNHSRIAKIEHLEVLTQVETLCLRQNLIKTIENVAMLTSLTELDLYDNVLTKMENLDGLVNLEILDLSYNRIAKIENLDSLVNLRKLFLVHNKIAAIENISHLTQLEMLELGSNRIRKLENLDALTKLDSLYVGKNKITKMQNMDSLTKLKILSLQSNRIVKMEGMDKLVNLEQLYISHNGIEKVEGLDNCEKLDTLDLAGNRISRIENVSKLVNLEEFWFNDNRLENWDDLNQLTLMKNLQTVYLERNPLWSDSTNKNRVDPSYRRKVMLVLPWVKQIDATYTR